MKKIFAFTVSLVTLIMLAMNSLTPYGGDDFAFNMDRSLAEAIASQYEQYLQWTGRVVGHFMIRVFMAMPKMVFNICNTFVFIGVTLLAYKLADPVKKFNVPVYLFVFFAIWLYAPEFGEAVFNITAANVHMWGPFRILCFLLPYSLYIANQKTLKDNYAMAVLVFALGLLAGWSNENASGGAILAVLAFFAYCRVFKLKYAKWMFSGFIGCVMGYAFLVLAPGNSVRAAQFADDRYILVKIASRFNLYTGVIRNEFSVLVYVFIVLLIVHIVTQKDWKRLSVSVAYFVVSLATIYAMILSPHSETGQSMFGATVFMTIACAHCLAGLRLASATLKAAYASLICVMAFWFATSFVPALNDNVNTYLSTRERNRYVETQLAKGNRNVVVSFIHPDTQTKYNSMNQLEDLSRDPAHWINVMYARTYGLETVTAVPYEEWLAIKDK
jgi:hypothetical protein